MLVAFLLGANNVYSSILVVMIDTCDEGGDISLGHRHPLHLLQNIFARLITNQCPVHVVAYVTIPKPYQLVCRNASAGIALMISREIA